MKNSIMRVLVLAVTLGSGAALAQQQGGGATQGDGPMVQGQREVQRTNTPEAAQAPVGTPGTGMRKQQRQHKHLHQHKRNGAGTGVPQQNQTRAQERVHQPDRVQP